MQMNKIIVSLSRHFHESVKPRNLLLRLLLTGQVVDWVYNDVPSRAIWNPINHTKNYQAIDIKHDVYTFPHTQFQSSVADVLLQDPEEELNAAQDILQSITDALQWELNDSISHLESMWWSFSFDEKQLITTYVQENIWNFGSEVNQSYVIHWWILDIEWLRNLAEKNKRITLLILIAIFIFLTKVISDKWENFAHKLWWVTKDISRKVWVWAAWILTWWLWYFIAPELFDIVLKPLKSIPLFNYISVGQLAWFVGVYVAINIIPYLKKAPWYIKVIIALLLSAWLYKNIMLDPKAIIKDKNTWQPFMKGTKSDNYDYSQVSYDEYGQPTYLSLEAEKEKTEEEEKELAKRTKKLIRKQNSLLSEMRMLGDVREVKWCELMTNSWELLWKCTLSYTSKIVDPQYGTLGPDKITYTFVFYPVDDAPINMNIVINHFDGNVVQSDTMTHVTSPYKDIEWKVKALKTVRTLIEIATQQLKDFRVGWISKLFGEEQPTEYSFRIIKRNIE